MDRKLDCYLKDDGKLEIFDLVEEGGAVVYCYPDGRIELFEIPQYGGEARSHGNYPTVCAAFAESAKWT